MNILFRLHYRFLLDLSVNEGDFIEREGEENDVHEPWWKKKKKNICR